MPVAGRRAQRLAGHDAVGDERARPVEVGEDPLQRLDALDDAGGEAVERRPVEHERDRVDPPRSAVRRSSRARDGRRSTRRATRSASAWRRISAGRSLVRRRAASAALISRLRSSVEAELAAGSARGSGGRVGPSAPCSASIASSSCGAVDPVGRRPAHARRRRRRPRRTARSGRAARRGPVGSRAAAHGRHGEAVVLEQEAHDGRSLDRPADGAAVHLQARQRPEHAHPQQVVVRARVGPARRRRAARRRRGRRGRGSSCRRVRAPGRAATSRTPRRGSSSSPGSRRCAGCR